MKHSKSNSRLLLQVANWIFIGLLAYMPLHIFLSTWIGTSFGLLEELRIAKDVVLLFGFLITVFLALKDEKARENIKKDRIIWLIIAYGLLTAVLALVRPTDTDAELLGVVYNTRFLVFFLYGLCLNWLTDRQMLRKRALIAVFASAFIVLVFGMVQYTLLPNDALRHVGYTRENGVLPAFFIDDKPDLERVMSTLRDPNSYGSYIIIVFALAAGLALKSPRNRQLATGFLALCSLNLWFTFSRSAWVGCAISLALVILIVLKEKITARHIKIGAALGVTGLLILGGGLFVGRDTYFVKNVVFHADESTVLEDPNELRIRFWKESVQGLIADPAGSGPGTAGLASIRNNVQGTELNENYYLQIASEAGVLGLLIFASILVAVAIRLYRITVTDWLIVAVFASFIGLAVTNFLVHIWSNEAVAYTWWGLAAIAVTGSAAISHKSKTSKNSGRNN